MRTCLVSTAPTWIVLAVSLAVFSAGSHRAGAVDYVFEEEIGGSGTGLGEFDGPTGIVVRDPPSGQSTGKRIFVADTGNNRIQRGTFGITGDPDFDLLAVSGTGLGEVDAPQGLAIGDLDRDGLPDLIVADAGNNRVQVLRSGAGAAGGWELIAGAGTALGEVISPRDAASGLPTGRRMYIADTGNNRVQRATFDAITGDPDFDLLMVSGSGLGEVLSPSGITSPRDAQSGLPTGRRIFVADTGNNRIQRVTFDAITGDPDFDLLMTAGSGLGQVNAPEGLAYLHHDADNDGVLEENEGLIFVADTGNNRVQMGVDDGNNINWFFVGEQSVGLSQLSAPKGLDVDSQGRLYVADTGNNRIVVFAPVPEPSTLALAAVAAMGALFTARRVRR